MSEVQQPEGKDEGNTTFYSFKESGTWYASGRGVTSEATFRVGSIEGFSSIGFKEKVLRDNGGKFPGLSSRGLEFFYWFIVPDDAAYGYPVMVHVQRFP